MIINPNPIVKWIVHDRMLVNTSYTNLEDIIRSLGYECYMINGYSLMDDLDQYNLPDDKGCVIPYCTINLMRQMKRYFGLYGNENNLKTHVYTSLLGLDYEWFLNADSVLTTYYQFRTKKDHWYKLFGHNYKDAIFIRPDSGIKLFTGHLVAYDDFEFELNSLNHSMSDETLMWISDSKNFWDETRFIICGDEVIDGSRYATMAGLTLVEDKCFPEELWDVARKVASCKWRPDEIFTCDVCMTSNGPKIVELNSASCAGWYACDIPKVVKAISEHTLKLYKEQYELVN